MWYEETRDARIWKTRDIEDNVLMCMVCIGSWF